VQKYTKDFNISFTRGLGQTMKVCSACATIATFDVGRGTTTSPYKTFSTMAFIK